MVAKWLQPNFKIVCVWLLGLEGLWLRYAALQNLIPSFPWIAPCWRVRAQILPSGNLADEVGTGREWGWRQWRGGLEWSGVVAILFISP